MGAGLPHRGRARPAMGLQRPREEEGSTTTSENIEAESPHRKPYVHGILADTSLESREDGRGEVGRDDEEGKGANHLLHRH
eukprot:12040850-Heterocapsa_arctica.AAC.1